ncbi:AMP-dependent synthetase [Burkholderia savannae]|uniref:AMP-binding protein n=1 Tax=Burkholderia savannae TaxID=1637837 RepID=UPI000759DA75|nr:AMP-binding protein [Burkholderia savannae]AOJ83200.1 AMP-dependent synthetase [Burkholderia savannae]
MTTTNLPKTINELLRSRAAKRGEKVAYLFLSGQPDDEQQQSITFADLDRSARRVALLLQRHSVGVGERVLLLCRPGLDYICGFLGCLYAGAVAVPVYPPRNRQHAARIVGIVESAGAKAILCTGDDFARCTKLLEDTAASHVALLDLDAAKPLDTSLEPAAVAPSHVAFLQYTSGTTGKPKGVMVTHGNLMHNLALIGEWMGYHEESTMVSWLPPYHDMGLIGGILTSLFGGFRCVLMAPERFIQHPFLWLRAISDFRADVTGAPDFAYRMCSRRIPDEQLATLDLSCLKTAYSGAESVRYGTLAEFAQRFAPTGFDPERFKPCYGLAECTLLVAGRSAPRPLRTVCVDQAALQRQKVMIRREFEGLSPQMQERDGERVLVSVGVAIGEQRVVVRDLNTNERCADDEIGEICVAGESVAPGYWQQYEQTIATFQRGIGGEAGQEFAGTGDLGFHHRGDLYVTGRLKDMIIIAGRNYYSEDVEYAVIGSRPELVPNGCAAFTIDAGDEERLVVVAEIERTHRKGDLDALLKSIRESIWLRHDISPGAVLLVSPGSVPKTSSGKVRRSECRNRLRDGELTVLARWDADDRIADATRGAATPSASSASPAASAPCAASGAKADAADVADPSGAASPSAAKVEQLKDWLRHYARTRIDSRTIDERRTIPPHIVLDFGNEGLLGMQIDRAYGGLGFTNREMLQVVSQLATIDSTLAFFVGLNNTLGIRPIMLHAQPALRDELLPLLATGRTLAAFALTEPAAGSNVRAIGAAAQRVDGDHWLVSGQKSWSGSSAWAGVINVFAKQADGAGMVGLAVRQGTPGLRIGAEDLTMGVRGMIQNTLHLDRARVSDACRLGAPGQGMALAQQTMNFARLGIGAVCVGGMKRCAQLMHRYGARRQIGTGLLLDNPLSRQRLGDLRHRIDGLTALIDLLAADFDAGRDAPEDGLLIAKILGSEFLSQTSDELMQMLGGRGYIETNLAPQIFRDARLPRIFEGPTETLLAHLGSRVLNGGDDLLGYLSERTGAGALASELRGLGEQLLEDGLANGEPLGGAAHATNWVNYWLGSVAQWALLLAAVEQAAKRRGVDAATLEWAQSQYELAVEAAQRQVGRRRVLSSAAQLAEWARRVEHEIGPIEQTVPGAQQRLDPLLRAEYDACPDASDADIALADDAPSPVAAVASAPIAPIAPADPELKREYEQWLVTWLGERLRNRRISLTAETTFADIGLDSILAVELTMAFSDAFRTTVDASAVWDHASIDALATHLATRTDQGARPHADAAPSDISSSM